MKEVIELEDKPPDFMVASPSVIERLRSSEQQRSRLVFEQYTLAVELLRERVLERITQGLPQTRWETGVAAEIGLALRISPHRAARILAHGRELEQNLPHIRALLRDGELSPEAVPIIVTGLSHLDPDQRRRADEHLCTDPAALAGLGPERLKDLVQQTAYDIDAKATVDRIAVAEKNRTVTIRPLPDAMARVSLLLPLTQAVGVYAALRAEATTLLGNAGELRNRGQIMADTAYHRLTGRDHTDGQPVTVNLTVPATVLLADQPGTAHVAGGGPLPAEIARTIIGKAAAASVAWVKRLYIAPETGAVVAMDSRQRLFPDGLAEIIAARDRYCRTPYCDAPIAHTDHMVPHAAGGPTTFDNGQGLCAACNYAKEGAGWHSETVTDETGRHTVETRTPSGHRYRSTAPDQAA